MPNATPPHKKRLRMQQQTTFKMTEFAIQWIPYFKIETIEIERGGTSYT